MSSVYPIQSNAPQANREEERASAQGIGRNIMRIMQFTIPIIAFGFTFYCSLNDPYAGPSDEKDLIA